MTPDLQRDITEGAYWMRKPGPNCDLVIAYTGTVAPEAIEAVGLIGESHRDVGLLAVTSADRLYAGWSAAQEFAPRPPWRAAFRVISSRCWRRSAATAAL